MTILHSLVYSCSSRGVILPGEGKYATGMMFIEKAEQTDIEELFTGMATQFGLQVNISDLKPPKIAKQQTIGS